MPKISLAPYMVRIHRRGVSDAYEPIDAFDGHTSLYGAFSSFCQGLLQEGAQVDAEHERALRLRHLDRSGQSKRVWGLTRGGAFGYEADLYDITTGEEAQRRSTQAELIPFYFVADLSNSRDFGILLVQGFGNLGIKGHLTNLFSAWMAERYPDYLISFSRLVPHEAFEELITGNALKAIHFVKFEVPADSFDALDGVSERSGSADLRFQVRGGLPQRLNNRLRSWHRSANPTPVAGLIELRGEFNDFEYDTIKIEVAVGSSTKTVDLSKLDNVRATFNVDSEVEKDAGGHPLFDSIHRVARQHLDGLLESFESAR